MKYHIFIIALLAGKPLRFHLLHSLRLPQLRFPDLVTPSRSLACHSPFRAFFCRLESLFPEGSHTTQMRAVTPAFGEVTDRSTTTEAEDSSFSLGQPATVVNTMKSRARALLRHGRSRFVRFVRSARLGLSWSVDLRACGMRLACLKPATACSTIPSSRRNRSFRMLRALLRDDSRGCILAAGKEKSQEVLPNALCTLGWHLTLCGSVIS